ncbi:MAG: MoaD/ThiS family protein [Synergistaceae bacterium]|nr:MoaD/ThiS family protein [Synergistaceae bacterium]
MKVLFFANIRDYTGVKETEADGPQTIMELLISLAEVYGREFHDEAFEEGEISDRVIVMVNGRHIAHTGGGETPLSNGDTVAIFPIIGGG